MTGGCRLQVERVSFAYPRGRQVLTEIDWTIEPGRRVALLGANGEGKSTLLLLLNGTLQPGDGVIRLGGEPFRYDRDSLAQLRRSIGLVTQDPDDQLFGATVEQDIAFGPLSSGVSPVQARTQVRGILERLGIIDLIHRQVHELSLGEKKRVALAGVLVMGARVILLDEPTAGLDYRGVLSLIALLDDLVSSNATIVMSTHDTDFAYEWADDAALIGDGRIVTQATAGEIFANPQRLLRYGLRVPRVLDSNKRSMSGNEIN